MLDVFSPRREEIETTLASLAASGAFPELARPGAAALAWLAEPLRLVWASPPAAALAAAVVVDGAGLVASSLPASERLTALASGLAPRDRVRLEKLRFETSAFAPLSTCACRLVALPDGTSALVTIFLDRLPRLGVARPTAQVAEAAFAPEPAESAAPEPVVAEPVVAEQILAEQVLAEQVLAEQDETDQHVAEPADVATAQAAGGESAQAAASEPWPAAEPPPEPPATIRFLWESDAEGRITHIAGGLAEAVGAESARVEGRRFADLIGERVHDPKNIVAELIARGETFSGRTVHWRVGDGEEAVPVDLAGLPVRDRERSLAGYRGFGLCRPRNRLPWTPPPPVAEPPPVESAPFDPLHAAPSPLAEPRALIPTQPVETEPDIPEAIAREPAVEEPVVPESREAESREAEAREAEAREAGSEETGPQAQQDGVDGARQDADPSRMFGSLAGRVGASFGAAPAASSPEEARAAEKPPASAKPALSETERHAFREIARALGATPPGDSEEPEAGPAAPRADVDETSAVLEPAAEKSVAEKSSPEAPLAETGLARVVLEPANDIAPDSRAVLDRLPAGVVVHRGDRAIFVNRYLLDLLGYDDLDAFQRDGGLARLFRGRPAALEGAAGETTAPLSIATREGGTVAVEVRLTTVDWCGAPASMLMLRKVGEADPAERLRAMELDLRAREESLREQAAVLDTATDGVALLDQNGRILSLNRAAEALFGYDQREVTGEPFTLLLQMESHVAALGYLEAMRGEGLGALLNDGREVLGRERQGGPIPLFMTLGLIGEGPERKFCVVLRDMTAFKQAESELVAARRAAERASAQKSDFLAKISHEIRTPLNAIIGFAEVMLEERFGPVGNERYRDYVADIHASGAHVISLVNDLLDLAKVEAGRMELTFGAVALNELVGSCVALMQPQAARDRIVLRTSFGESVPPVEADERALRQIVLNLLSNAVKFTDAGGQVIVSTAVSGSGEVVFRVRDTGIGMNEADIETALEPFRQLATSRRGGGTGLGLPLTKALVEANRGTLKISSRRGEGTLVEVALRSVPATAP